MKRELYEIPTTEVVQLEHQAPLLEGSVRATRTIYGDAYTDTWGDEG